MQNRAKPYNSEEYIDYKPVEFDLDRVGVPASSQPTSKPARHRRFLPGLKETVVSKLVSVQPSKVAIAIGQGMGYVLVGVLVLAGQVVWFIVQMLSALLYVLVRSVVSAGQESLSEYMSRHKDRDKDIDWRDIPIGQHRTTTRQTHKQGPVNNVNVNIHIKN